MTPLELTSLIRRLASVFPAMAPLRLRPPVEASAWSSLASRFAGGHARRWFAACGGQPEGDLFYDGHGLCSLDEAVASLQIFDEVRRETEADDHEYWVEPHWVPIASDLAGRHLMIDDRHGRVLSVAHDDDHVVELGASPELWLAGLLRDFEDGPVVYAEHYGLIEREVLRKAQRDDALRHIALP